MTEGDYQAFIESMRQFFLWIDIPQAGWEGRFGSYSMELQGLLARKPLTKGSVA